MDEIIFEVIKVIVMVAALVVARYLVPWLKEKIGADKLAQIEKWATYAVEMAQQVHWSEAGQDKKAIVTEFLKEILTAKNISISDEQLNVLIEAAVKEMKMQENAGNAAVMHLGGGSGQETITREFGESNGTVCGGGDGSYHYPFGGNG